VSINIKIEGMTELAGQLEKLKDTATGSEVRDALIAAAQMVSGAAKTNAPTAPYPTNYKGSQIAPGGLKRSITAAPGRQYKTFLQAFAFSLKNTAPHASLVEFGTKPHSITPKDKKFLVFGNLFKRFARSVQHPGSRSIPFFRDAVRSQRSSVKRLLETRVKAAFDALAKSA
jgi:HK97 gp10 family phage protein